MSMYTEPRPCEGCRQDFVPQKPLLRSGRLVPSQTCSEACRLIVAKRPRGKYVA